MSNELDKKEEVIEKKKKMRILVMTDSSKKTGFGQWAYHTCSGLGHKKEEFELFHLGWGLRADEAIQQDGYVMFPCGNDPFGADVFMPTLNALNPEALITMDDSRMLLHYFPQIRQQIKATWIHCPMIDEVVWSPDYTMDKWPSNWTAFMKTADYTVASSEFGQRILKANDIEAEYIPIGVDTSLFKPLNEKVRAEIRKNLTNRFVILYVFKNMGRKMPGEAIKIFRIFKDAHPEANAALILHTTMNQGEFNLPLHVVDYGMELGKDVFFSEAAIPFHMMNAVYNAADVYMTPSGQEGFNMPLLEAMASGLPCLAADCATGPELIGDCGLLGKLATYKNKRPVSISSGNAVELGIPDIYDFADKLETLYKDEKLRKDLGAKATVKATEKYDWNLVIEKWKNYLHKNCSIELPQDWEAALR